MITRTVHDSGYGLSIALNCLLIALITTKTPSYLRSYSLLLLYLAIVQLTTAVSSIIVFKKVMSTSTYYIDGVDGVCRHWSSPSLCLIFDAIQMAGSSQHGVMIAFCSCYRYFVIAISRCESKRSHLLFSLVCAHLPTIVIYANFGLNPLLEGTAIERAINDSYPSHYLYFKPETEMMLVIPQNLSTVAASLWIQTLIVPVCVVVLICSTRINHILASVDHMSAHSKERHAEILRCLLIQASLPALYGIIIVVYRITKGRTDNTEELRHITPMMASILTALSPALNIFFTLPYRETLERNLPIWSRKRSSLDNSANPFVEKTDPTSI